MSKHNKAELEKRERNATYALKFKKPVEKDKEKDKKKKRGGTFANWCRIKGHLPSCSCILPSREELVGGRR